MGILRRIGWFRESRRHADAYYKGQRKKALARKQFLGHGGKRQQLFITADVPEKTDKPIVTKEEAFRILNEHLKSKGLRPLTLTEKRRFY